MKKINLLMSDAFFEQKGKRTVTVTAVKIFQWQDFHFAIHRTISKGSGRSTLQGWQVSNLESGLQATTASETVQQAKEDWDRKVSSPWFNPALLAANIQKTIAQHGLINDPNNLPSLLPREWQKVAEDALDALTLCGEAMERAGIPKHDPAWASIRWMEDTRDKLGLN